MTVRTYTTSPAAAAGVASSWTLYEHCTLFPATIRASWRVALVFHRSGVAAAFYRPFSKVPSCDRPAPSRYDTCPLSPRNVGDKGVKEGSFDQKERENSYPLPVPKAAFIIDSHAADAAVHGRRYCPGEMRIYRTINTNKSLARNMSTHVITKYLGPMAN